MDVLDYDDYREFLKSAIAAEKQIQRSVSYASLAEAIRVERSYLSHVIHGRANLSSDQLYLIAKQLRLTADDIDYLLLLLEIEKCQVEPRRKELCKRRDEVRRPKKRSEAHLETRPVVTEGDAFPEYYSDPDYSLVHMCLSINEFSQAPGAIAERLGIRPAKLSHIISTLERWGLIALHKGTYKIKVPFLHLREDSPLAKIHADSFRLRGIAQRQRNADGADYFFTATFAATEAVRTEVKEEFLSFLKRVSKKIKDAPTKDVFHINFDLFRT